MGVENEAEDLKLGRHVALKLLPDDRVKFGGYSEDGHFL
jgi:hypothetical protein